MPRIEIPAEAMDAFADHLANHMEPAMEQPNPIVDQPSEAADEPMDVTEKFATAIEAAQADIISCRSKMEIARGVYESTRLKYDVAVAALCNLHRKDYGPGATRDAETNSPKASQAKPEPPVEPVADPPKTESPPEPAEPAKEATAYDSWRSVPCSELKIANSLLKLLADGKVHTLGDLNDINTEGTKLYHPAGLESVEGVGRKKVERVIAAVREWWEAHPEYADDLASESQDDGPADEPADETVDVPADSLWSLRCGRCRTVTTSNDFKHVTDDLANLPPTSKAVGWRYVAPLSPEEDGITHVGMCESCFRIESEKDDEEKPVDRKTVQQREPQPVAAATGPAADDEFDI